MSNTHPTPEPQAGNDQAVEVSPMDEIFEAAFGQLVDELASQSEDHPLSSWCTRPETVFASLRTLERLASRAEWLADADLHDDAAVALMAAAYRRTRIEVLACLTADTLREAADGAVPEIAETASVLELLVAAELAHTALRTWLDTPAWTAGQHINSKMTAAALDELSAVSEAEPSETAPVINGQYL